MEKDYYGALYGFAVGDALGVPVEFYKREHLIKEPICDMTDNPGRRTTKGYWSDDTAMTLCSIQAILDSKKISNETHKLEMDNFVKWMDTGYLSADNLCFGIGQTVFRSLLNYKNSKTFNDYLVSNYKDSEKNGGNGALMRILPLILYFSKNKLIKYKEYDMPIQIARTLDYIEFDVGLTHQYGVNKEACCFYALFIYKLLETKNLDTSYKYAVDESISRYSGCNSKEMERILLNKIYTLKEENIKSSGYVVDTLEASLWCLFNSNNYKSAVLKAVNLGGDADTIAAITGSMAGIYYGYDSIPKNWINCLLNKKLLDRTFENFVKKIEGDE